MYEFYSFSPFCHYRERASRVILISANEYLEVASIGSGNIAVAVGLKEVLSAAILSSVEQEACDCLYQTLTMLKCGGAG